MVYQLRAAKEVINLPRIATLVVEMVSPWNKNTGPTRIEAHVMVSANQEVPVRAAEYSAWRRGRVGFEKLLDTVDALDFVMARRFIRYAAEHRLHVTRIN